MLSVLFAKKKPIHIFPFNFAYKWLFFGWKMLLLQGYFARHASSLLKILQIFCAINYACVRECALLIRWNFWMTSNLQWNRYDKKSEHFSIWYRIQIHHLFGQHSKFNEFPILQWRKLWTMLFVKLTINLRHTENHWYKQQQFSCIMNEAGMVMSRLLILRWYHLFQFVIWRANECRFSSCLWYSISSCRASALKHCKFRSILMIFHQWQERLHREHTSDDTAVR